jgi:hypothetical protein
MPRATNAIDDDVECTEVPVDERAPRLVVVVDVDERDGGRVVAGAAVEEWSPTGGDVLGVCCAPTAGGGAVAAVVGTGVGGAVVGGGAGTQIAVARAGPRGGGSVGSPEPSGCQRQPSTIAESTRDAPGPKFEYDHLPPLPCQYDQYA